MTQASSTIATVPTDLAAACASAAGLALTLSKGFLILALVVAVLETGLAIWARFQAARKGPAVADAALESIPAVDPVKLLDALKGLLETLKAMPAWIALFLAGVLLFWVAGNLAADGCAPAAPAAAAPPSATQAPDDPAPTPAPAPDKPTLDEAESWP